MSEQAKILAQMQELIMTILKNGAATPEEGAKIDYLEDLLNEQKCYNEVDNPQHDYLGEEITSLFIANKYEEAINKLHECKIIPNDFFDFVEYHYEDDDFSGTFTDAFIADVNKVYQSLEREI